MDRERVIFTSYHIVKIIFKHLDARSLSKCAQVCSLWYRITVAEKKRRQDIFCIPKFKAYQDIEPGKEIYHKLFQELKNIPIQPIFCLAFMSYSLYRKFKEFFPSFGSEESGVRHLFENSAEGRYFLRVKQTALKDFLPENCNITLIVSFGIVGCNANCVPLEIEIGPAMSGVFIPEIEGVQINKFCSSEENSSTGEFLDEAPSVKALIILYTSMGYNTVEYLIHKYSFDDRIFNMAVGGASAKEKTNFNYSIVAFSGPNVEAASIIIRRTDKIEDIYAKLETFKETGLLKHKCFAFMFACNERGYNIPGENNEERTIFCKMYPKVPLIGMYGEDVLGNNFLPNYPMEKNFERWIIC